MVELAAFAGRRDVPNGAVSALNNHLVSRETASSAPGARHEVLVVSALRLVDAAATRSTASSTSSLNRIYIRVF